MEQGSGEGLPSGDDTESAGKNAGSTLGTDLFSVSEDPREDEDEDAHSRVDLVDGTGGHGEERPGSALDKDIRAMGRPTSARHRPGSAMRSINTGSSHASLGSSAGAASKFTLEGEDTNRGGGEAADAVAASEGISLPASPIRSRSRANSESQ